MFSRWSITVCNCYIYWSCHIGLVLYILHSNKITYRISKVRVTNHKSLLKLPAAALQLAATTRFAVCPSHLIDHRRIEIHRMHRNRLQLTYAADILRARTEVYRGARKARFPLKPLYRTDRDRDTHIALCRSLSQKKQNLPSAKIRKNCNAVHVNWSCNSVHVHLRAHTGQRDELRHDADHSNVHKQTERNPGSERKLPAHAMARCRHNGANDWQSQTRVWCARKGATQLVATMNESREWECCKFYYVQTRCVNESCVASEWQVEHDLWPAGVCVWRCAWTTNKQLAERWTKGRVHYLSRPTLVNWFGEAPQWRRQL